MLNFHANDLLITIIECSTYPNMKLKIHRGRNKSLRTWNHKNKNGLVASSAFYADRMQLECIQVKRECTWRSWTIEWGGDHDKFCTIQHEVNFSSKFSYTIYKRSRKFQNIQIKPKSRDLPLIQSYCGLLQSTEKKIAVVGNGINSNKRRAKLCDASLWTFFFVSSFISMLRIPQCCPPWNVDYEFQIFLIINLIARVSIGQLKVVDRRLTQNHFSYIFFSFLRSMAWENERATKQSK